MYSKVWDLTLQIAVLNFAIPINFINSQMVALFRSRNM